MIDSITIPSTYSGVPDATRSCDSSTCLARRQAMAVELKFGAGGPYRVRPVWFKGMQYAVKDRTDTTVYLTRSNAGANRRASQLNEAWMKSGGEQS